MFFASLAIASLSGVSAHLLYFIRGEHHLAAPHIGVTYLILSAIAVLYTCIFEVHGDGILHTSFTGLAFVIAHVLALWISIIIYRLFFHRLRRFPGPLSMRVSKLTHIYHLLRNKAKNHILLEELREEYGDIVRTGPNELTIFDPQIISLMSRPKNDINRGEWYDLLLPSEPMATTRNRPDHDARKKAFDPAFSTAALDAYNARISQYVQYLDSRIASTEGRPANVRDLFYWLTFDILGDIAFGYSFGMLKNDEWHSAATMLRQFMALLGHFSPAPWLVRIGLCIPGISDPWWKFKGWCIEKCQERIKKEKHGCDVDAFTFLLESPDRLSNNKLEGDALSIIIAGSDTTAATLVFLFNRLAAAPQYQKYIRKEVSLVENLFDPSQLEHSPWLNAVIAETLRLHPPVPTGGQKTVGPSGLQLGETYIPAGVAIFTPRYSMSRLESCYERPQEFLPERWYNQPELVKDKNVHHPFAKGRYSCPGKALAMREIRLVVALLLKRFNVEYLADQNVHRVEADMKDEFAALPGPLWLCFK